ncbi:MAG: glutathione peroxidase [Clostridia bacterium]|nr:glutathione peroxidase [Clostridia bacterium]
MNIYDLKAQKRNGETLNFNDFKGKVLLIVNTATGCGFTPQYEALENLYKKYKDKGLEILDFPCDQFGHQAPGSDSEIHDFCVAKYKTSFDQLKKVDVNGENADSVWKYLKENSPDEYIKGTAHKLSMKAVEKMSTTHKEPNDIKWNFTKFLVDKNGKVAFRYSPIEKPDAMEKDIVNLLK